MVFFGDFNCLLETLSCRSASHIEGDSMLQQWAQANVHRRTAVEEHVEGEAVRSGDASGQALGGLHVGAPKVLKVELLQPHVLEGQISGYHCVCERWLERSSDSIAKIVLLEEQDSVLRRLKVIF